MSKSLILAILYITSLRRRCNSFYVASQRVPVLWLDSLYLALLRQVSLFLAPFYLAFPLLLYPPGFYPNLHPLLAVAGRMNRRSKLQPDFPADFEGPAQPNLVPESGVAGCVLMSQLWLSNLCFVRRVLVWFRLCCYCKKNLRPPSSLSCALVLSVELESILSKHLGILRYPFARFLFDPYSDEGHLTPSLTFAHAFQ